MKVLPLPTIPLQQEAIMSDDPFGRYHLYWQKLDEESRGRSVVVESTYLLLRCQENGVVIPDDLWATHSDIIGYIIRGFRAFERSDALKENKEKAAGYRSNFKRRMKLATSRGIPIDSGFIIKCLFNIIPDLERQVGQFTDGL